LNQAAINSVAAYLFLLALQIGRSIQPMNKRLWMLSEDECRSEELVAIAARHTKLALEHLNRKTSIERKQTILSEIAQLRLERDALLDEADCIFTNKI
jgi:hypothetical protein